MVRETRAPARAPGVAFRGAPSLGAGESDLEEGRDATPALPGSLQLPP